MDKEKEIEELAKELEMGESYPYITNEREMAERLVTVGYGNVEEAVKEFAEELKERLSRFVSGNDEEKILSAIENCMEIENCIDQLVKEKFGEESKK